MIRILIHKKISVHVPLLPLPALHCIVNVLPISDQVSSYQLLFRKTVLMLKIQQHLWNVVDQLVCEVVCDQVLLEL